MFVQRIQVEEGFLNGFDLKLSDGLNVIIGARGTGKTSVIELLRYALGAKNHTAEAETHSVQHARAILQGGQVTVELQNDEGEVVMVTRGAQDDRPSASGKYAPPIVLSQTEIETVGLSEAGRLALLDGFVSERASLATEEASAISSVRSIFKEIGSLELEISSMQEGKVPSFEVAKQIAQLEKERLKLEQGSGLSAEKQKKLASLMEVTAQVAVQEDVVGRFLEAAANWTQELERLEMEEAGLEVWSGTETVDPLATLRPSYRKGLALVKEARSAFQGAWTQAGEARDQISARKMTLEKESRAIRTDVETHVQGSGAIARQLSAAKSLLAQAQARERLVHDRGTKLLALRAKRDELLDELQLVRDARFARRVEVAKRMNAALGPHIDVQVLRSAQYETYAQTLSNALRGSGMKYADLALRAAEHVSPRELLTHVEGGDFPALAELLDIPQDRAARLAGHLRDFGMADVATCLVEDDVSMTLLDGVGYKDISALSAGQRCTVILSIVLQHRERTLVIDQPEDHLDNAFIASTVIRALRERKGLGQVLLSTHNANIPVLGEADLVVQLSSDGRNGFIQLQKPLDHPFAVEAISTVMEGGRDAFDRRAEFYRRNSM